MNNETLYRWTQKFFANYQARLAIAIVATITVFALFPRIYASQGSTSGALLTVIVLLDTILLGTKAGAIVWLLSLPVWILQQTGWGNDGVGELKNTLIPSLGTLALTLAVGTVKKSIHAVWQKHQSESTLFQALIEKATDGVILLDEKGQFKYISPVARRIFGYAPADEISFDPAVMTFPEDLPMVLSHLGRLLQDPAYVPTIQYRFRNKAGGWHWVESTFSNLLSDPHVEAIVINFRDITDRKAMEEALREGEERFRSLYEHSSIGLYRTTPGGDVLLANPTLVKMLGYQTLEELTSVNLQQSGFAPSYDRNAFIAQIESNGQIQNLESEWKRRDGSVIFVSESARAVRAADGTTLYYDGTVEDITEQTRLKQQLLQAQKLEGVGTLAGGIAHDFNNLLSVVLGAAELLQSRVADQPELKKFVDRIIEASERGTSISRQLLIFSRPDQAELKPISLSHTILELREMLHHFLPKTIDVQTSIDVERGIIMGDKGQIHQALLNLALNAGDAMTNQGTLTIREYSVGADLIMKKFSFIDAVPYVAMSVSDTGSGIEPSHLDKIFDPFFSTKERGKGTGLGLAMVHGIVKNHKGFIEVTSLPGKGTTFTMYFPTVALEETREEKSDPSIGQDPTRKGTILLVDDEEDIRELYSEYLHKLGYTVHVAADGFQALSVFTTHRSEIDLVVTDLGMANMGGEELFRRLHQLDPAVKVVVSSGYLDGVTKEHLLSMGILEVLSKPSKLRDIERTLSAALADCNTDPAIVA